MSYRDEHTKKTRAGQEQSERNRLARAFSVASVRRRWVRMVSRLV